LEFLASRGLSLESILNTHGHADHIAGNEAMKSAFPDAQLVIGVNDVPLLTDPGLNVSRSYGFEVVSPPPDQVVREPDELSFAGLTFKVLDIPGHSPGHVIFVLRDHGVVFGGDVLFRGSIGRTDFPGGSFETLADGIRKKLYSLPNET